MYDDSLTVYVPNTCDAKRVTFGDPSVPYTCYGAVALGDGTVSRTSRSWTATFESLDVPRSNES